MLAAYSHLLEEQNWCQTRTGINVNQMKYDIKF